MRNLNNLTNPNPKHNMTSTTTIEWTNHTINFWWGCTKVSPACTHCYAEEMGQRFGPMLFGQAVLWGAGKPRFERLEAARKEALKLERGAAAAWENWTLAVDAKAGDSGPMPQRPRVFVNSMSDWLDDEVPLEWLAFLLQTIWLCPNLDFQLLTKRPENWRARLLKVWAAEHRKGEPLSDLCKMTSRWTSNTEPADIPSNIWIGTTVENQRYADERIPHLLKIPARVRFLSMEPLSGAVDLRNTGKGERAGWIYAEDTIAPSAIIDFEPSIHWVIAGGESGGKAVPAHPDWFRSLRDQCRAAGVPFFFKQWGEWIPVNELRYLESNPSLLRSYKGQKLDDGTLVLRVGKETAGHLLDGEAWRQFPQ